MKERHFYYVLGLGQTGQSVVRFLKRNHQECEVFDDKATPAGLAEFQKAFPDIQVHLHENPKINPDHAVHEIIASPGVPLEHPIIREAREKNIAVIGDIELFARYNQVPVVGITGTNGKSTVTTLVGEMAKASGFKTLIAGNIGTPVLDFCDPENPDNYDWVVLELSSFQLESTFSLHPKVACILNITEDHMDRYASFDDYAIAKHRIFRHAENKVISTDDPLTWPKEKNAFSQTISFGLTASDNWHIREKNNQKYLAYNQECLLNVNELKIKGTHNWSNALAALAIGQCMRLEQSVMCDVLKKFPGLDHRCQWVREWHNVNWYNDSKGTNVGATLSAIKGLSGTIHGKIILLLGGQSKGADFSDLCEPLKNHVRTVILYGEDADKIESMLKKSSNMVPIIREKMFEKVVEAAQTAAQPGDVVLLSPACASWDMFDNYAHRGRVFTQLVQAFK